MADPIKWKLRLRTDDPTRAYLDVECRGGTCTFPCSTQKSTPGILWQWDGDVSAPSLAPSIACQQPGCGKHFNIACGMVVL